MSSTAEDISDSEAMRAEGRAGAAVTLLSRRIEAGEAGLPLLTAFGVALNATGRLDEAIDIYGRAARDWPRSGVAEHNLAGALGDAQRFEDSEAATRRAFAKGLDAPETWLVHARALQGQDRFEEARAAYGEALRRRPTYADAHADLAGLVWMLTADLNEAAASLDAALRRWPGDPALSLKKAKLLEYAGDLDGAYGVIARAIDRFPNETLLHVPAAQLATNRDPILALDHANRAFAAAPRHEAVLATLAQANLAAGRPEAAEAAAQAFLAQAPNDQYGLALLATAWRLAGDPRYAALCDHDRLVGGSLIDTPAGWASLELFLADLAATLAKLHPFRTHPVGQSVRQGSQTHRSLSLSDDPAIRAFFEAVDGPIRRHIAGLGSGDDPLRRRIGRDYRLNGAWSVRLRPGGFHVGHTHDKGWISSACHIALPAAVGTGQEGWLAFGAPGVATDPALAADHIVKPKEGRLVLFPSYMWHGTIPFSGAESRLTIAFDVIPV